MDALPFDPFGFVGSVIALSLLIPLITTVLILGVIVWAVRRAGPAREDPAVAELKAPPRAWRDRPDRIPGPDACPAR